MNRKTYKEMKQRHPNMLLLFRVGDFYELYREDAEIAAKLLGLTLTSRTQQGETLSMAGFPYHALEATCKLSCGPAIVSRCAIKSRKRLRSQNDPTIEMQLPRDCSSEMSCHVGRSPWPDCPLVVAERPRRRCQGHAGDLDRFQAELLNERLPLVVANRTIVPVARFVQQWFDAFLKSQLPTAIAESVIVGIHKEDAVLIEHEIVAAADASHTELTATIQKKVILVFLDRGH